MHAFHVQGDREATCIVRHATIDSPTKQTKQCACITCTCTRTCMHIDLSIWCICMGRPYILWHMRTSGVWYMTAYYMGGLGRRSLVAIIIIYIGLWSIGPPALHAETPCNIYWCSRLVGVYLVITLYQFCLCSGLYCKQLSPHSSSISNFNTIGYVIGNRFRSPLVWSSLDRLICLHFVVTSSLAGNRLRQLSTELYILSGPCVLI